MAMRMKSPIPLISIGLVALVVFTFLESTTDKSPPRNAILLIVVDGLRPDYVTPEYMPNLHALGEHGVFGARHTAVFPSVTRVNSASISTGSYPVSHGLMHNTMFLRQVDDNEINTGSASHLLRMAEVLGGRVVDTTSLGEVLADHGLNILVVGSGGSGNSLLQNPTVDGFGIWTAPGFFLPAAERSDAVAVVGELPKDDADRTVWSFDAYMRRAIEPVPPDVTIMWIHETDGANHAHGIGSPQAVTAARNVDVEIGRTLRFLDAHDIRRKMNIFVTSDHGFSTHGGRFSVSRTLRRAGFSSNKVRVVQNMIYLNGDDSDLLEELVEVLQRNPESGNIYTRPVEPGSAHGVVPGTLSTAVIQWDHEHASDVLVSAAWSDDANSFGFKGTNTSRGGNPASHGSDSPYDLSVPLVAAGPDIKKGIRSTLPSGNVDLAPTILHLLRVNLPESMTGRVLSELLIGGPAPHSVEVREETHKSSVVFDDGYLYEAELSVAEVDSTPYVLRGAKRRVETN